MFDQVTGSLFFKESESQDLHLLVQPYWSIALGIKDERAERKKIEKNYQAQICELEDENERLKMRTDF